MSTQLVASPEQTYARELLSALGEATSFVLVTAFATASGVELIAPAIKGVLERGGTGRIILAVDRRGFNAAPVFEALLALKSAYGARLSIGLVPEEHGLLHAKAMFTRSAHGTRLLVGSANLTHGALHTNHELGVLLDTPEAEVLRAFERFVTGVAPRSLDGPDARGFLQERGLVQPPPTSDVPPRPRPSTQGSPLELIRRLPPLPPLDIAPEEHLAGWIDRGYLVGRGRRSLDAIVLRLPQEQLIHHGLLRPHRREDVGAASHETRTMGYGVNLVPRSSAEGLRRETRRVALLLAKVTLNLPCFGLWMPESYWEAFLGAREVLLQRYELTPARLRELAEAHREELERGGLEREVDSIVARLQEQGLLVGDAHEAVRERVLRKFRSDLMLRTPDVIASCLEFRTARQRWAPFDRTELPHRQLMVDIVQGTFSATYRTGDWPRRFRSFVARRLAQVIEARLGEVGGEATGSVATALLDEAATWESPARLMTEVVDEFRRLVPDELSFPAPSIEELTAAGDGAEDEEVETDDVR